MAVKKTKGMMATAALSASIMGLTGVVSLPAAQAQDSGAPAPAGNCTPVHIVAAQGTGGSGSNYDPSKMPNAFEGKVAVEMAKKFPGKVSHWSTPYPASAGAFYSAADRKGETTTYGHSRLKGAKAMVDHVTQYKSQCPGTKFLFTGFSQGASVAGDAAALIAHGASKNVKADDAMGALLYSDPDRAGNSQYTGPTNKKAYIPLPPNAQYQRNGEFSNAGQKNGTVGWVGQRSLDFKGMEGKVISICNPMDAACSVQDKSLLRDLSDMSDKNWKPLPANYDNKASIKQMLDKGKLGGIFARVLGDRVISKFLNGDINAVFTAFDNAIERDTTLTKDEKDTLRNASTEAKYIVKLLRSDKGYGKNVPVQVMVAHLIKSMSGDAASLIPDNIVPPAQKPLVQAAINAVTNVNTSSIPPQIAEKMRKQAAYLAQMPKQHMSYYKQTKGTYQIGNQLAEDWVLENVAKGIENVLNNTPYTVEAGSNPKAENAALEVSDPQRMSDGLKSLVDPNWVDPDNFDPRNYIKESVAPDETPHGDGQDSTPVVTPSTSTKTSSSKSRSSDTSDSSSTKSSIPTSSSASPITPAASDGVAYGPKVNTGGSAESASFFDKVVSLF